MKKQKCNWRLVADELVLRNLKGFTRKSQLPGELWDEPEGAGAERLAGHRQANTGQSKPLSVVDGPDTPEVRSRDE